MKEPLRKLPDFPTEITFKVICRKKDNLELKIWETIQMHDIIPDIDSKESRQGTFISYTISAIFPTENMLHSICQEIASMEEVMTIF